MIKKIFIERKKTKPIERFLFLILLFVFGLSLYYKPINYYQADWRSLKLPDLSPMHHLGVYGPTCGLTRSFINLAHGRIIDGFFANFMGPPTFLFFLLSFFYLGYRFFGGKKRLSIKLSLKESRILVITIICLFLISWLIRMATPLKSLA